MLLRAQHQNGNSLGINCGNGLNSAVKELV